MSTRVPVSSAARLGLAVLACAAVLLGVLVRHLTTRADHAEVVGGTSGGRQTIEYHGVRVDVPRSWSRTDTGGCEFELEHWSPPGASRCGQGAGVAFLASATFDAATGPGVRLSPRGDGPTWSGYVDRGRTTVFVADDHRALVEQVLGSAR